MSFTRFHDDPARIKKRLEESTYAERYFLNTPGNGVLMPFEEDVYIRCQYWGANRTTNTVNLESDFRGLTRKCNRDLPSINCYAEQSVEAYPLQYSSAAPRTDQSRAVCPAYQFRDMDLGYNRFEYPFFNPQDRIETQFPTLLQTRILEKDHFKPKFATLSSNGFSDVVGEPAVYIAPTMSAKSHSF